MASPCSLRVPLRRGDTPDERRADVAVRCDRRWLGPGTSSSDLARRPGADPRDVALALAATRPAFEHRAAAVGADRDALLRGVAAGEPAAEVDRGVASVPGRTVFVYPGQASPWAGMALDLLTAAPAFAARWTSAPPRSPRTSTGLCATSSAPRRRRT